MIVRMKETARSSLPESLLPLSLQRQHQPRLKKLSVPCHHLCAYTEQSLFGDTEDEEEEEEDLFAAAAAKPKKKKMPAGAVSMFGGNDVLGAGSADEGADAEEEEAAVAPTAVEATKPKKPSKC